MMKTTTTKNDNEDSSPTSTTKGTTDRMTSFSSWEGGLTVIGAGFGRTGTASMQEALNILGFGPCYHMREVFKDPKGVQKWNQVGTITNTKKKKKMTNIDNDNDDEVNWDDIFDGYQSTVDFPAATYYKELSIKYPNAKVILTVREEEKWWNSYSETIAPSPPIWRFIYTITGVRSYTFDKMVENCVYKTIAGNRSMARQKEAAMNGFKIHNETVKATIPSHKLLIFNVKEGWEPLCQFLNCPIPNNDIPFPHTNDTEQFKKFISIRKKKAVTRLAIEVGVVIIVSGIFLFRRGSGEVLKK